MADKQTTHRPEVLKAEQSNSLNSSKSTKKENSGDRQIDIAFGKHRNDKTWKNKSIEWSAFVERCSKTHRTAETIAAYLAAPKSRQDEIKDVGAFVGGYLAGGRRKKDSITHRQLITLDADFATPDIWNDFTVLFGGAGLLYSTHKHLEEKPRVRLLVPLDRTVNSDEYEAIARKIAGEIGIEQFDHTTFQANRLMYWPSTSKDGVFWFEEQDGEFLSADEILGKYTDWTDTSEWPTSEKENAAIKSGIKKQGEPTEKPGLIGLFCRVYGVHEVIEKFLSEVYEPCDMEDRYSFIGGSTSGGLIVYEDKFAFSHHGTDPTSGKLCNAFDLVRIHLFGLRDEDKEADTPINKLPSYLAMSEFAGKDESVKQLLLKEKLNSAREDFVLDSDEEMDVEWSKKLDIDRKGNVLSSYDNLEAILRFDPLLKGKIGYDEFSNVKVIKGKVPWDRPDNSNEWGDIDEAGLRSYMGGKPYEIKSKGMIEDCLIKIAYENRFHSIRDYLEGLTWDGIHRLDTLFIDYLGAEDTALNRILTRKTLVAAVARIYRPGCKFDYVLTLISDEGAKKSTLLYNLGRGKWFSDSLNFGMISGGNGKQAFEQIQNRWIIEIAEMTGLKKAEVEAVKAFITSREDYYRASHSAHMSSRPRQCIFVGTSNNMDFLVSQTGNRRFWPMPIKVIRPTKQVQEVMPEEEIGQLWAEAVVRYDEGETLYLTPELEDQMRLIQQRHTEVDPRESRIQWYLDSLLPENWTQMSIYERRSFLNTQDDPDDIQPRGTQLRERVSVGEIWTEAFEGQSKDMTSANTKFIQNYMRRKAKDWESKTIRIGQTVIRGYVRKVQVPTL